MEPNLVLEAHLVSTSPTIQQHQGDAPNNAAALTVPATASMVGSTSASPSAILTSPSSRLIHLRSASEIWKLIDLDHRRTVIDGQALSIVDEEDRSVAARKSLSDQTKSFKKLEATDQLTQVGPLVKSYQNEIGALTTRAKTAEQAFLTLYKALHDAPDPHIVLAAAIADIDRLLLVEENLKQTQATLAEYETEFQGLKSQDVTVRKLERENRDLLASFEQRVAQVADERIAELKQSNEDLRRAFLEDEKKMQLKIDCLKEQLSTALSEKAHLASAALNVDRRLEDAAQLRQSTDTALLENELEQARAELINKDQQLAELRALIQTPQQDRTDMKRLEDELEALQLQLEESDSISRQLRQQLAQAQQATIAVQTEARVQEEKLVQQIASLRGELVELPTKAEVDELKRQLQVLQDMECHPDTTTNTHSTPATPHSTSPSSLAPSTPLLTSEQVLISKCRRLEAELTRIKLDLSTVENKNLTFTNEIETLQKALQTSKDLNAKLEEDLLHANSSLVQGLQLASQSSRSDGLANAHHRSDSSLPELSFNDRSLLTEAGAKVLAGLSGATIDSHMAQSADAGVSSVNIDSPSSIGVASLSPSSSSTPTAAALQQQLSQSASMLSLISQQRDRYRAKLDIVEAQSNQLRTEIDKLKAEQQVLKQDNMQLYEKIQFLKSMAAKTVSSSSGSSVDDLESGPSSSIHRLSSSTSSESKYAQLWESRMNPFAAFKAKARQAREESLSTSERLTLAIGRAFFSKKLTRTILFGYALILHLLVMTVLWKETIAPHCATAGGMGTGAHQH